MEKSLPGQVLLLASTALGILIILSANMIMPLPVTDEPGMTADVLILLALVLMVWSVLTLGRAMFAATPETHLITHGLYRYSRHPFYLALILGFLGLALMANNWLALAAALLIVLPVQILRAKREEKELEARFGEEWTFYKSRTAFMLPGLW